MPVIARPADARPPFGGKTVIVFGRPCRRGRTPQPVLPDPEDGDARRPSPVRRSMLRRTASVFRDQIPTVPSPVTTVQRNFLIMTPAQGKDVGAFWSLLGAHGGLAVLLCRSGVDLTELDASAPGAR